jgi:hypothetical protein
VQAFGKYQIEAKLGRGAFGEVFRAYDPVMRRRVAIKVLPADSDPEALKRFRSEANIMAELSHRNIVRMYEFDEEQGCPYLVMELLEGETLKDRIASGTNRPLLECIDILYQVAQGLRYAHANGVTHGDIKPANIIIDSDGVVKITDFGTAVLIGNDATRRTHDGGQMGTVPYMAPEFFQSGVADQKTDIFAYGVVCYEFLSGMHPFRAEDEDATVLQIITVHPAPLGSVMADCPERLQILIDSLLRKDPAMRCGSLDDLVLDLRPILSELRARRADEIFSRVVRLMEAQETNAARNALQQVLELQPEHAAARSLRDEMRQRDADALLDARLHDLKERGRKLEEVGQFGPAIELFTAALELKPGDEETAALIAGARRTQERARRVARLLSLARWHERAGELEPALEKISDVLQLQPENRDAQELSAKLQRERERRQDEGLLVQAEKLISQKVYDRARAVLNELTPESPVRSAADGLSARIEREEEQERFRREHETAVAAAALRVSIRQAIEHEDFEQAVASLERARMAGESQEQLDELSAAIARAQREQELNSAAQRVRSALQEENFEVAERELAGIRQRFADEPLCQSLEREFREYQHYGTALLMAEQANAIGDRQRAKDILASSLRVAKDGRARAMLDRLEQEEKSARANVPAPAETTPTNAIPEESVYVAPALPVKSEQDAEPASETEIHEYILPAPEKPQRTSRSVITAIAAGVLVFIAFGFIVYKSSRATPHARKNTVANSAPQVRQQSSPEVEWEKLKGTQDVNAIERYVSLFPNGPFSRQAMDQLEDLRWQQLDHNDANALKIYLARFPNGPHASETNELITRLNSDEEVARKRAEIESALNGYASAIRHRSEEQLRRAWPGIPDADLQFWLDSFAKTKSISLEVSPIEEPKINGSSVHLYCRRKITKIYRDGRPPYSDNGVVSFELRRRAGGWIIASVSAP